MHVDAAGSTEPFSAMRLDTTLTGWLVGRDAAQDRSGSGSKPSKADGSHREGLNMNAYAIAMFVHMIGLIALFGGLVIIHHGGVRLRAAGTWQEARTWLDLLRPTRNMFIAGAVFLLGSGMFMARAQWTMRMPWIVVGMIVVLMFLATGALVSGRIFARIARAAAQAQGPISDEARALIHSPLLW